MAWTETTRDHYDRLHLRYPPFHAPISGGPATQRGRSLTLLLRRGWHGDGALLILPDLLHVCDALFQRLAVIRKDPLGPDHALIPCRVAGLNLGTAGAGAIGSHDKAGNMAIGREGQEARQQQNLLFATEN